MKSAWSRPSMWFAIGAGLLAALISGATAAVATGSILAALAPLLFARFIAADFEGTLTAALAVSAGMALIALSNGTFAAIVVAAGGYIAADISIVAAKVHRRGSVHGVGELLRELAQNVALALATLVAGAVLTAPHAPSWLALTALAALAVGGLVAYLFGRIRSAPRA